MTKADVILNAINSGASDDELLVLENTPESEFNGDGKKKKKEESLNDWERQHKENRKKLEDDLKKQGLEEVDIIRELQNFDEEERLQYEQVEVKKGGIDGVAIVNLPEVVVPPKNPISTILNVEDYNDKTTGDKVVKNTNNWLNSYIGNRGFKAEDPSIFIGWDNERSSLLPGEYTKITAANGNVKHFNLEETQYGIRGEVNPVSSLEDITTWLDSQKISNEEKYIFNLTNQTPGENGLYNIKAINKKDINPTVDVGRQLLDSGYKVDGEQLEVITNLVHSSIEKAITNPESMGLSARYSSIRAGELSEDDKDEIRTAVFNRVNRKIDVVIGKADFNKLFKMYDGIVRQINTENNNAKNLSVSGEELNPEFEQERLDLFLANLNPKMKIKYGLNQEILKKEEELNELVDTVKRKEKIQEINDLKAQIIENAKIKVPIVTNDPTFRAWGGKPPTVVIENPELSSMLFNNEYSIEVIEEAGELAEEFKSLSILELAILANSLPATMTDREIYKHYHDNILKIRQNTEKEFLGKEIGINMDNLDPAVRTLLFQKFPQSGDFYPLKDKDFKVSIQKLYDAGFNSHKLDLPFILGETMSDKDRALYEDYEAFRLKSIADEFSMKKMIYLNIDMPAIKKNISLIGSAWNGLVDGTKTLA